MQMQTLLVAANEEAYFAAKEAGQPLPWMFLFQDRMSGEYLALIHGNQCKMYAGHPTYMQHCDDVIVIPELDGEHGSLEFEDAHTGAQVDSVEFGVSDPTLYLERFSGVTWHRVDASHYTFEISDQSNILKISER